MMIMLCMLMQVPLCVVVYCLENGSKSGHQKGLQTWMKKDHKIYYKYI